LVTGLVIKYDSGAAEVYNESTEQYSTVRTFFVLGMCSY